MDDAVNILLQSVKKAGEAILTLQKTGFTIQKKVNHDIVTEADYAANEILQTALLEKFPDDGWLSEESVLDKNRLQKERIWIVDPIDGTKEYAHGIPEYAISVALIEKGEPILAAIFNPASNELFHAVKHQGAWLNNKPIHCRPEQPAARLLLLASRSEYKRGEWEKFIVHHEVKQVGSIAYKLGLIAAGMADATFSLGPKNEWDIAAGVLLVQEAGGVVTDRQRNSFLFNRDNVLVDGIVASSKPVNELIFSLIED